MRSLFLIMALLVSFNASALTEKKSNTLPTHSPTVGGVAVIILDDATTAPKIRYNKDQVAVTKNENDQWVAVVGIPLKAKPGKHTLLNKTTGKKIAFDVFDKAYPEQWLTIKNKRKVNPNAEDMKRIKSERTKKWRAKNTFTQRTPIFDMQLPVIGRFSSAFGLKRFFNKQPRSPHGGIDIAAPRGTPIHAPADGVVVEAQDFFFSGNCIYIEHGQGVTSFYAHMDEIDVEIGDQVKQGQIIGKVGSTGRSTGPHLHWSIGLNGTWVDPALFIPKETRPQ